MEHWVALRTSLLLAMGIVPVACGGTVQRNGEGTSGSAGHDDPTGSGGASILSGGTSNGGGGSGTAGNGGGLSSTAGSGGVAERPFACTTPRFVSETGLTHCTEGFAHRSQATACRAHLSEGADTPVPTKPRAQSGDRCSSGATGGAGAEDCSAFELGFCRTGSFAGSCMSGCVNDDDCGAGFLCECGHPESPSGGVCVEAVDCRTDADCAGDSLCASFEEACGYGGFACLRTTDACRSAEDCKKGPRSFGYCTYANEMQQRTCDGSVCGRPFLVRNSARLAAPVNDASWAEPHVAPRVEHLTTTERHELAAHWSRMGQMEHASIAAFARFGLQLLSLGAPPSLVERCAQALADETAHTRLCFSLASDYAGHVIGPGPLDVQHSLEVASLADIADLVIAEGCFGETRATLEAQEGAATATDPAIAAAYARIAADEQRHAELAFCFVRWALEQDETTVRARIEASLVAGASHGASARKVVEPCLRALLAIELAA